MKKRDIAISDIHGCYKTFRELVEERLQLTESDTLYLLGDYIDRGPSSKAVIDYILQLQKNGYKVLCLRGNHEQMLLDATHNLSMLRMFRKHGGKQTMESYGCTVAELRYHRHFQFFQNLKYYIELEDYYLVHAGFNFRTSTPFLDTYAMLWVRDWYHQLDRTILDGKIIVHGHTPIRENQILSMKAEMNQTLFMNIDAGCFYHKKMCALDLTNQKLYFQDCLDKVDYL